MKIAFLTLGCKVNKYETDLLKEKAEAAGYLIVDFNSLADIYCINSCSVTNMSDRKTRQMVSKARKQNEDAIIAAIGCSVESEKESITGADIILGNSNKRELIDVLKLYINNKGKVNLKLKSSIEDISKVKKYDEDELNKGYDIREAIKIEDGCNNFCSYCIIPYLRGRIRSRNIDSVVKEVKRLCANGVKEIILVGIEVASYGKDLEDVNLFNLLSELEEISQLERIRLSSLEPRFLTAEHISKLSKYKKLCPHFHISMQSGNNEVLKRMNRKYTKEELISVCKNLKQNFEEVYLAADLIVGFPGETNEEFKDTIKTIYEMGLSEIHVFRYSKRKYTLASKMDGQVDGNIKKERSQKILEISSELKKEYLNKFIERKVRVLFENESNGYLEGITKNYIKVKVKGESNLCGTIQDVVITSLEKENMIGILI